MSGNSSPGIKARAILALHGLCRAPGGQHHPLLRGFLQVIEVDAAPQGAATQSRIKVSPITVSSAVVAGAANHQTSMNITVVTLGLLLSGEPGTTGGGVREGDDWTRDLARHWSPQPFVVASREHGTS